MFASPLAVSLFLVFAWNDLYVDGAAPNCATGTGTESDPVCTIGAAIALASPGDTIRIAPGSYEESLILGFDLNLVGVGGQEVTFLTPATGAMTSGMYIAPTANVNVDGLSVSNFVVVGDPAGIWVEGGLVLRNSIVRDNESDGIGIGGGIGSLGGAASIVIENSTIRNNTGRRGAGISMYGGELTIRNSTISGNIAGDRGSGLFCSSNSGQPGTLLVMENSTLSGNRFSIFAIPAYGGGAYLRTRSGSALTNVTVTDNSGSFGSGLRIAGQTTMRNCVVAGNQTGSFGIFGGGTSLGHNFIATGDYATFYNGISGDQVGYSYAPLDAMLGPLAENGGPTRTHRPLAGSPLLDASHPNSALGFDQRGTPRPTGTATDIGAVEFGETPLASFCSGDGGDQMGCTDCPCSNNAAFGTVGGCLNRTGNAARITASGSRSVSLPATIDWDLRVAASGLPPNAFCVLTSGHSLAPTNPANPCFGLESGVQAAAYDGLRCAVGALRRHGGRAADAGGEIGVTNNPWGGEGLPPIGLADAFGGFVAGEQRYFQAVYREDPLTLCMRGLNTSQAIEVTWTP